MEKEAMSRNVENKSKKEGKTLAAGENTEARKLSGFFKDIFTQLYQSPKS
ncbi:MAG: hypothetical protein PHH67_07665 [Methanosarcina sp.]|jgi:hypothetical protein|nr:hypothetical protein [Methanosarcina sp.]MDD4306372.1 hypothetical protein [Methanosarcina sp.]NLN43350.1 hypothetical protein [Methanosarcina sp.]